MISCFKVTFTDMLVYSGVQMELTKALHKIVKNTSDRLELMASIHEAIEYSSYMAF